MLKIGISACFFHPDPSRTVFGPKTLLYLENDMANYICQENVLPILIPELKDEKKLNRILAECDGFIFQGGSDLSPISYGEEGILNNRWKGDRLRDIYELNILDYAVKNNKPVLGICRGCQLINVYFGGTLYQDIATEKPNARLHRDAIEYDQVTHSITLNGKGWLPQIYPNNNQLNINSIHHQALNKIGADLMVEAICEEDGIVEAVSYAGKAENPHPFLLGVQWHPEFFYNYKGNANLANPKLIMDYFLSKLKK